MSTPASIGRYRIVGELGHGGMGVVYRALDPELDREVAVKLITLSPDASRELRDELEKRFRREAKAAARIRHPGVVAIHDVGVQEHGLYLVMERVDGESLQKYIERGTFPERAAALELVARAADALAAAHDAGLVHRDVKPANILLSSDGRVMLTDFGVARSLDEVSELTRTGMVVGSPAYMAPEQLQGGTVDGRADLFSLGVVLYELLLHKRPFPAHSITTLLYQILHEDPLADPTLAREIDEATAEVLRRLLAKSPAERFPDARSAAATLRGLALATPPEEALTRPRFAPLPLPPPPPAGAVPAGVPASPGPAGAAVPGGLPGPAPLQVSSTHVRGRAGGPAVPLVLLAAGIGALLVIAALAFMLWNRQPEQPPVVQAQPTAGWTPGIAPAQDTVLSPSSPAATPLSEVVTEAVPAPTPLPGAVLSPPPAAPMMAPGEEAPRPPREEAPPLPTSRPTPVATAAPEPVLVRLDCRKGVSWDVEPDETEVWIDGKDMGQAHDMDDVDFEDGWHTIQLVLAGYRPVTVQVETTPSSDSRRAEVKVEMQKLGKPDNE